MSGPLHEDAVHLTVLDDSVAEQYRYRGYLALCGVVLAASDLPCASCPEGCDCDPRYCPECVRAAAGWNAEAAEQVGRAPAVR